MSLAKIRISIRLVTIPHRKTQVPPPLGGKTKPLGNLPISRGVLTPERACEAGILPIEPICSENLQGYRARVNSRPPPPAPDLSNSPLLNRPGPPPRAASSCCCSTAPPASFVKHRTGSGGPRRAPSRIALAGPRHHRRAGELPRSRILRTTPSSAPPSWIGWVSRREPVPSWPECLLRTGRTGAAGDAARDVGRSTNVGRKLTRSTQPTWAAAR
jgi:hypothetical protein